MDKEPLVYLIIVSYNGYRYVLRLLKSVCRSSYKNFTVLLVDNHSADNTIIAVKTHFPMCKIINNKSNLGFAAGCNVGLQKAIEDHAEFIFLLNQDCLIQEDTLSNLLTSAQNMPSAGVIGPKTWFHQSSKGSSRPRILYAGAWRFLLPLVQRVPGVGKYDNGKYDLTVPVDYVWGHGMFLRTSALQVVGLFDPRFFMYYEDLDLCCRMVKAGYQVWYEPSAVMWHDIPDAARGSESKGWRWEFKCRSAHLFHIKYARRKAVFILDFITIAIEIFRRLWSGQIQAIVHIIPAWIKTTVMIEKPPTGFRS